MRWGEAEIPSDTTRLHWTRCHTGLQFRNQAVAMQLLSALTVVLLLKLLSQWRLPLLPLLISRPLWWSWLLW